MFQVEKLSFEEARELAKTITAMWEMFSAKKVNLRETPVWQVPEGELTFTQVNQQLSPVFRDNSSASRVVDLPNLLVQLNRKFCSEATSARKTLKDSVAVQALASKEVAVLRTELEREKALIKYQKVALQEKENEVTEKSKRIAHSQENLEETLARAERESKEYGFKKMPWREKLKVVGVTVGVTVVLTTILSFLVGYHVKRSLEVLPKQVAMLEEYSSCLLNWKGMAFLDGRCVIAKLYEAERREDPSWRNLNWIFLRTPAT